LNQQREALTARQEEMSAIDKRISELQERLHRKRLLNQQLANQISAASHKAAYQQFVRLTGANDQNSTAYNTRKIQTNGSHHPNTNGLSRTNIAAVEPYNHVPMTGHQPRLTSQETTYHPYQPNQYITKESDAKRDATSEEDLLKDFNASKSDPKYQTLPYNTKFTVNLVSNTKVKTEEEEKNDFNGLMQLQPHTVHSAPLNVANKNIATPLLQKDISTKPISSVAPTSVHAKLSTIYQTSSIKDQPV